MSRRSVTEGKDNMSRERILNLLTDARACGYAVPHFNFASFFELLAIAETAAEMKSPVFVASLPKVTEMYSPVVLRTAVTEIAKRTNAELFLHLDHTNRSSLCKEAVDAGYDSVMMDASRFPLEENISAMYEVAEYAHARGCAVEGEIGKIKSRGDTGSYEGEDCIVQTEDAIRAAQESGVDYLAVAVGTAHGFYQGQPKIRFERLEEVASGTTVPLVLHGGTGIPEEEVKKCIARGISKVNVGTIIRYTYLDTMQKEIVEKGALTPPVDLIYPAVTDKIKEVLRYWIRVCGSEGKSEC